MRNGASANGAQLAMAKRLSVEAYMRQARQQGAAGAPLK